MAHGVVPQFKACYISMDIITHVFLFFLYSALLYCSTECVRLSRVQ